MSLDTSARFPCDRNAAVYVLAGGFLLIGLFWFVNRDAAASRVA
jgi:hypothetical protein